MAPLNEAETRAEHIDPALKAAGWGEVEGSRVAREIHITRAASRAAASGRGPRSRTTSSTTATPAWQWSRPSGGTSLTREGAAQAKEYAKKLGIRFTYATNGQAIYEIDMAEGTEGDVAAFPTPEELWERTFAAQNAWRDRFAAVPFETQGGAWGTRYYQDIAIGNVLEAVAAGKQRILLTMATGTGKTGIAAQVAWKLFRSRWNLSGEPTRQPRILFLADRNILADQAYNAFSFFPRTPSSASRPGTSARRGRSRRTARCSSRSSRPS